VAFRSNTSVLKITNESIVLLCNGRDCVQHSTNRRDDYCVTHGHGLCWT